VLAVDETLFGDLERALERPTVRVHGRVLEAAGTVLRVAGIRTRIGELCRIVADDGTDVLAETIGFRSDHVSVVPFDKLRTVKPGATVIPLGEAHRIPVGDFLLGRVLDGFGMPFDGRPMPEYTETVPVDREPPNPIDRPVIRDILPVGVRVLDAMATLGVGQRVGLFAVAGGGKTTLLKMMARNAAADVVVMSIVGERGRELNEFLSDIGHDSARERLVCVVTTSDRPAFERSRAAFTATAIAEYFRDQGRRVLLLVDSVTRFARAQRELGVAIGEPVARRGYTVSVFSELARLMERAGPAPTGSITAIYTVLVEDEQVADPIAEEVRSIVDGHLVLSRAIGERGQYPALDVLASLSRLMAHLAPKPHRDIAQRIRALMAKYNEVEMLYQIGEYQAGSDPMADAAIAAINLIRQVFTQSETEPSAFEDGINQLKQVLDAVNTP
jgi:type III secretion protein N (ATPase)